MIYLLEELKRAAIFAAYGVALMMAYDFLRIARRCIKHNTVAVSVEDLLYWVFAGFASLVVLNAINDGGLRFYFVIGASAGAYLFEKCAGCHLVRIISGILCKFNGFVLKKIKKQITIRHKKRGNINEEKGKNI